MCSDLHPDQAIARLAAGQQGNVTHAQLLAAGLWPTSIGHRVRRGSLHRVHHGVYSVGRPPVTPLERAAAVVLACGSGAALSHASAMTLWGLWKHWATPFEVSVVRDRRPTGITVHHPRSLHRRDVTAHWGVPTTTPARTVFDMATSLTRRQLARAVNDALNSRYMHESNLAELLQRNPSHRGARLLAPFVDQVRAGATRSMLEDDFLVFCERYDLPKPKLNVVLGGYLADAYFENERLIIELDSWDFHSNRISFESDRNRDADHLTDDIPTVRITHDRLTDHPDREAARLRKILASRASAPAARLPPRT